MDQASRRARAARPGRRAAALLGAVGLTFAIAAPAAGLGEDGPFELPLESTSVPVLPGSPTRTPLDALIQDEVQDEIVPQSALLQLPPGVGPTVTDRMELGSDSRSIAVAEEGTWSLLEGDLQFTPTGEDVAPTTPVALSVQSVHGTRSLPVTLTPEALPLARGQESASAGQPATIPLEATLPEGGDVQLLLSGLPPGSSAPADGSRVTVPEQGVWQVAEDRAALTFTPLGTGPGRQPDPVRLVVVDEEGAAVSAGEITLSVPIISDLDRAAPYGQDVVFELRDQTQLVDPTTLRLRPPPGGEGVEVSDDGTQAVVPDQGTWSLDVAAGTVTFRPRSDEVRLAAPMGLGGGDGGELQARPAQLTPAYPVLLDRTEAARPGSPVQFELTAGMRDVRTDSVRFDPSLVPDGAELSADLTRIVVPGEGTWELDIDSRTITLTAEESFTGAATPVGISGRGEIADNAVHATFGATIAPIIPTARDDVTRTAPGSPLSVDVLGNDTAGDGSQPLDPGTLEIGSLAATNIAELSNGRGTRLVVPGEGTYRVAENGAIRFEPVEGFVGRTSPIAYFVRDSGEIPAGATLLIDVSPEYAVAADPGEDPTGINSLLAGLMPASSATSAVFGTIVMLLLFAGGAALVIGISMEADRRRWED